jgi:hypothetical protein
MMNNQMLTPEQLGQRIEEVMQKLANPRLSPKQRRKYVNDKASLRFRYKKRAGKEYRPLQRESLRSDTTSRTHTSSSVDGGSQLVIRALGEAYLFLTLDDQSHFILGKSKEQIVSQLKEALLSLRPQS